MFEQRLSLAKRALAAGNLAICDIVCRDILDRDAGNAEALNLLGIVSARVGALDMAAELFQAALRAAPASPEAGNNLAQVRQVSLPSETKSGRTLLIKSWGAGFWSDVTQTLGSLLLAEVTGRVPVVHWGANSLFRGEGEAFRQFFEPVSPLGLDDLTAIEDASYFPAKWNRDNLGQEDVAKWSGGGSRAAAVYFLNRPETIAVSDFFVGVIDVAPWIPHGHPMQGRPLEEIYRYLIEKYLRPQAAIAAASEEFFRTHLGGAPFAAVHIRGSDKLLEGQDAAAINQATLSAMASLPPEWRIFLATDDEAWRSQVMALYGGRVVTTPCQRTRSATGVHYLPSVDGQAAGREVMLDVYLALRAARFIGNGGSNVSAMIAVMKDWEPDACTLIGPNLLMVRNLYVHMRA